jgi:hypothetical protein
LFKECTITSGDVTKCYEKSLDYEVKPNFYKFGKNLEECVNKVAGNKNWESEGAKCFSVYEKELHG